MNQTEFGLEPNQSEKHNYNPYLVIFNNIYLFNILVIFNSVPTLGRGLVFVGGRGGGGFWEGEEEGGRRLGGGGGSVSPWQKKKWVIPS